MPYLSAYRVTPFQMTLSDIIDDLPASSAPILLLQQIMLPNVVNTNTSFYRCCFMLLSATDFRTVKMYHGSYCMGTALVQILLSNLLTVENSFSNLKFAPLQTSP